MTHYRVMYKCRLCFDVFADTFTLDVNNGNLNELAEKVFSKEGDFPANVLHMCDLSTFAIADLIALREVQAIEDKKLFETLPLKIQHSLKEENIISLKECGQLANKLLKVQSIGPKALQIIKAKVLELGYDWNKQ